MTIEKIKVQHPTSYNIGLIEEKLNTIIDWINEHDNSGRHIVPSNSLTGGEKEECDCTETICCPKHPNTHYENEPKSNTLRAEILYYLFQTEDATVNVKAEKILSLVKEHLLAELPEADKGGMSLGSIKQIIKNL